MNQLEVQTFREARRMTGYSVAQLRLYLAPNLGRLEPTVSQLEIYAARGRWSGRELLWKSERLQEDWGWECWGRQWGSEDGPAVRDEYLYELVRLDPDAAVEWVLEEDGKFLLDLELGGEEERLLAAGAACGPAASGARDVDQRRPVVSVHRVVVRCIPELHTTLPEPVDVPLYCLCELGTGIVRLQRPKRDDAVGLGRLMSSFAGKLRDLGLPPGTFRFVTWVEERRLISTALSAPIAQLHEAIPSSELGGYEIAADKPVLITPHSLHCVSRPGGVREKVKEVMNLHNRGLWNRRTRPLIALERWVNQVARESGRRELSFAEIRERIRLV